MNYTAFVKDNFIIAEGHTREDREVLHATLGLVTEMEEISKADSLANFLEEVGDFAFYAQALLNTIAKNRTPLTLIDIANRPRTSEPPTGLDDFVDIVKKLHLKSGFSDDLAGMSERIYDMVGDRLKGAHRKYREYATEIANFGDVGMRLSLHEENTELALWVIDNFERAVSESIEDFVRRVVASNQEKLNYRYGIGNYADTRDEETRNRGSEVDTAVSAFINAV